MSTFRKTVLTTAIIGAGLATTAGSAFATDCSHDGGHKSHESSSSSKGCSNSALGKIDNSHAKTLIGVLDGSQGPSARNICDNLNGNHILSGNSFAVSAAADLPTPLPLSGPPDRVPTTPGCRGDDGEPQDRARGPAPVT